VHKERRLDNEIQLNDELTPASGHSNRRGKSKELSGNSADMQGSSGQSSDFPIRSLGSGTQQSSTRLNDPISYRAALDPAAETLLRVLADSYF
jgi:hypothetical protein